jgi:hypothetical protein
VGTFFLISVVVSHFIWLLFDPTGSETDIILGFYIFSAIYFLEWISVTCVFFTAHPMAYDGPKKFFKYVFCCGSALTSRSTEMGTLERDKSKLATKTISAHETDLPVPPA